jgi:DNA-directed RNA polymerase specialized sigma24 family protein
MAELKDLKQETFCQAFACIGTETFSKAEASALAAGYAETSARNTATKLLRTPSVQKRIIELHTENCGKAFITESKVLADIEHDKLAARDKGDYATAARCDQLHGQFLALFAEKFRFEGDEERPQLALDEIAELKRLAGQVIDIKLRRDIEQDAEKLLSDG